MRRMARLGALIALLGLLAAGAAACSGGDDDAKGESATTTTSDKGITAEEAIQIAVKAWKEREPEFDVATVRPTVQRTEDNFDVAFVPAVIEGPGGEPHVVVDRSTGEVTEIYQTK